MPYINHIYQQNQPIDSKNQPYGVNPSKINIYLIFTITDEVREVPSSRPFRAVSTAKKTSISEPEGSDPIGNPGLGMTIDRKSNKPP